MMKRFLFATSLVALASPSFAQSDTGQFASKAAVGDMFEIQSSELALERSRNPDVQAFASKIIQDHRANSAELKSMLQRSADLQRIQLPAALDTPHQQKLEQLRSATAGFERAYRTAQIEAHEQAIQLFDGYARAGDNAELKAWAAEKVPVLRGHLQMAQALPQPAAPGTAATQPAPRATQPTQGQAVTQPMRGQYSVLSALGSGHIMASDLEGTRVRGAADENVGEIDDVVLDRNGRVVAVIVGVGGFLGIGEKNVAIPFEALEIVDSDRSRATSQGVEGTAQPAPGTARTGSGVSAETQTIDPARVILRGMTKEDLERAPEFRSVAR